MILAASMMNGGLALVMRNASIKLPPFDGRRKSRDTHEISSRSVIRIMTSTNASANTFQR